MPELPEEAVKAAARALFNLCDEPDYGSDSTNWFEPAQFALEGAAPAIRRQRDEEWEAKVKGEKGERWFVSVKEDERIDRSWPASCEDGETPQERLMGAGVKIVAVIPETVLREREEELRERLRGIFGGRNLERALAIFEENPDA